MQLSNVTRTGRSSGIISNNTLLCCSVPSGCWLRSSFSLIRFLTSTASHRSVPRTTNTHHPISVAALHCDVWFVSHAFILARFQLVLLRAVFRSAHLFLRSSTAGASSASASRIGTTALMASKPCKSFAFSGFAFLYRRETLRCRYENAADKDETRWRNNEKGKGEYLGETEGELWEN